MIGPFSRQEAAESTFIASDNGYTAVLQKERASRSLGGLYNALMLTYVVYALFDPARPDRVRYVGMTTDLSRRIGEHRYDHRRGRAIGPSIGVRVLHEGLEYQEAREQEWRTIRDLRLVGQCDLNGYSPAPTSLHPEIFASFLPTDTFADRLARFVA